MVAKLKYKVLGYTNPIGMSAVPLVTIIQKEGSLWAVFPDSSHKKLSNKGKKLEELESYMPELNKKYIEEGEYSYLTSKKIIITGSPHDILKKIKTDFYLTKDPLHKEMLRDLMKAEQSYLEKLEIKERSSDRIGLLIKEYLIDLKRKRKTKESRKDRLKDYRNKKSKKFNFYNTSKINNYKNYILKHLSEGKRDKAFNELYRLISYQIRVSSPKQIVKSLCDLSNEIQNLYKLESAMAVILYAEQFNVKDPYIWIQKAEVLKSLGDYETAKEIYLEIQREFPNNVVAKTGYAEVLKSLGDYETAKKIYLEIQREFPNDVVAKNGYAEVLKSLGDYEAAKEIYLEVQREFPNDVVAKNGYAEVLKSLGDYETAKEIYLEVQREFPNDQYSLHALGRMYLMKNNFDKYLKVHKLVTPPKTKDDFYHHHSFIIYNIKIGEFEVAEKLLKLGLQNCKFYLTTHLYNRTLRYLKILNNDYRALLEEVEKSSYALNTNLVDDVIHTHIYAENGKKEQAISYFKEIKKVKNIPVIYSSALLLSELYNLNGLPKKGLPKKQLEEKLKEKELEAILTFY